MGKASENQVPMKPGIYLMCAKPPINGTSAPPFSQLMDVIYVGRSENLKRRFLAHINTPTPKVRAARSAYAVSMRFWFLEMPVDEIKAAETLLINCFGPPANDKPGDIVRTETGPVERARST